MKLTVARIGRAHGLKGEVTVEVRTDIPEDRLLPGEEYETEPASAGPLTIAGVRTQAGRWYLRFDQIASREAAEAARGVELVIDGDESDEEDAWYVHELVGLAAVRSSGEAIGEVIDLLSMPAQDILVVKEPNGHRAMIPFVEDFVVEVDVEAGTVVVEPPYGLLSGEEPEATGETR
ncbi:ribosome maturation factor RimM [Demequina sp. NBRC 110053]|uniref:ribosome maturation factor RimM n=1 Tax=Demequina sp. NBRC 110053 TaxID=1570342 RepID=UPI0009FE7EE2|nr:ribosome maturation factor RimM [Demequina sp. NBRC 110053]